MHANPEMPTIPKGHKKQENIWLDGTEAPETPPDLSDYPDEPMMYAAWEEGIRLAQDIARDIGDYIFGFPVPFTLVYHLNVCINYVICYSTQEWVHQMTTTLLPDLLNPRLEMTPR